MAQAISSGHELMRIGWRNAVMLAEAQAVISMRLMGFWGFWPVGQGENRRMVSEKIAAMQEGQAFALRALLRGAEVTKISEAAMRPVRRRTRANVRRLSKLPRSD